MGDMFLCVIITEHNFCFSSDVTIGRTRHLLRSLKGVGIVSLCKRAKTDPQFWLHKKIEETTLLKPVNDPPNTEGKCGLVAIGQRRLD